MKTLFLCSSLAPWTIVWRFVLLNEYHDGSLNINTKIYEETDEGGIGSAVSRDDLHLWF